MRISQKMLTGGLDWACGDTVLPECMDTQNTSGMAELGIKALLRGGSINIQYFYDEMIRKEAASKLKECSAYQYKNIHPINDRYFLEYIINEGDESLGLGVACTWWTQERDVRLILDSSRAKHMKQGTSADTAFRCYNEFLSARVKGKTFFLCDIIIFGDQSDHPCVKPHIGVSVPVVDGAINPDLIDAVYASNNKSELFGENFDSFYHMALTPVFAAHQTIGDRGRIAAVDDGYTPRQQRQAKKRFGQPEGGWKHYTVEIACGKKKTAQSQYVNINDPAVAKRAHFVRGHYMTYAKEKPMCGREGLYGTFYVPPHLRGSLDAGVVTKDYVVTG